MIGRTTTIRKDLTAASQMLAYAAPEPRAYRVYSDRMCHVLADGGEEVTRENGMPLTPFVPEIINVPALRIVRFTLAENEITGSIWFTRL